MRDRNCWTFPIKSNTSLRLNWRVSGVVVQLVSVPQTCGGDCSGWCGVTIQSLMNRERRRSTVVVVSSVRIRVHGRAAVGFSGV